MVGRDTAAKRTSMRTGVTSNVGAKSKIQTKCMDGGRSPPEHTFKLKDKGHF